MTGPAVAVWYLLIGAGALAGLASIIRRLDTIITVLKEIQAYLKEGEE